MTKNGQFCLKIARGIPKNTRRCKIHLEKVVDYVERDRNCEIILKDPSTPPFRAYSIQNFTSMLRHFLIKFQRS